MELLAFVQQVEGFDGLPTREKCQLFSWYLHTHKEQEYFATGDITACFTQLHLAIPNVSQALARMTNNRNPPDLAKRRAGYKLLRPIRTDLDARYGEHPSTTHVSKTLTDLPAKIPGLDERTFFLEALNCYRVKAFRACIVMTWNLTFDHLLRWILAEPKRLADFNLAIPKRLPKRASLTIGTQAHFEEMKESEVLEVCGTAGLMSANIIRILKEKLTKRNISAHPSQVIITQSQADDVVTDLVNNVVLALI